MIIFRRNNLSNRMQAHYEKLVRWELRSRIYFKIRRKDKSSTYKIQAFDNSTVTGIIFNNMQNSYCRSYQIILIEI